MDIKNVNISKVGSIVGAVVLGTSLIVSECRRHWTKKKLLEAQVDIAIDNFVDMVKDAKIKSLEEEVQELKSSCKEKES